MSSIKDTVDKVKKLTAEKLSLLAEIEELKRMANAKADTLVNEIATLREEIEEIKIMMGVEKQQPSSTEILRENNLKSAKELAEKTIASADKLVNQVFACAPFSQYFDDWLVNLRQIVSGFESNSPIKVDEQFVKDRSQIFLDVEGTLAQKKTEESAIGGVAKALADNNHLLVETDKEYAEKASELSLKRGSEVERLTFRVHELERDMESQEDSKNRMFKKRTPEKLAQTKLDLENAKHDLEMAQQNFNAEQDKLHDHYEKKKQEITEKLDSLRKELSMLETDTTIQARQAASKALANAINDLFQRTSSTA